MDELADADWTLVYESNDVTECFALVHEKLLYLHGKHFPLKTKRIKEQHDGKPYISQEIKDLIKERNKLQRKFYKKTITYEQPYKSLRNRISHMISKAKSDHFKTKLTEARGNTKKTWSILNSVMGRNKKSTSNVNSHPSSDCFNTHFANVGQTLSNELQPPQVPFTSFLPNTVQATLSLRPVTQNELMDIINNSRDSAPGYDEFPMLLMKKAATTLCPVLTHVYNLSLRTGVVPDAMKIAKVTPIFKEGNVSEPSNFRPISVLISLSKPLERLYYNRLFEFLVAENILTNAQHGFRPKRSTETALASFTEYILNGYDNDSFAIGVFLDLSKAFDTVDHTILLGKLHHYGVRGTALTWLTSYLSGRQ